MYELSFFIEIIYFSILSKRNNTLTEKLREAFLFNPLLQFNKIQGQRTINYICLHINFMLATLGSLINRNWVVQTSRARTIKKGLIYSPLSKDP